MEAWLLEGRSCKEIAQDLDRSKSSVFREITSMGLKGEQGNVTLYAKLTEEKPEAAIRPIRVDLSKRKKKNTSDSAFCTLHWGDVHYPFEDEAAVEVLYQIAKDADPKEIYCHGDIADCWQISDYRPHLEKYLKPNQVDIQETMNKTVEHLARVVEITNPDRAVFLEGNHEERWERMLSKVQSDSKLSNLLRLPKLSEALTLDWILGLEELGYEYRRYLDSPLLLRDRLLVMHGNKANKYVSSTELGNLGKSFMQGHAHKIQNFTRSTVDDTLGGWVIGCLCSTKQPYTSRSDSAQGFAIVNWYKDNDEWLFDVEQIRIHDGRGTWRGKLYKA